jgi:hypothetical protein
MVNFTLPTNVYSGFVLNIIMDVAVTAANANDMLASFAADVGYNFKYTNNGGTSRAITPSNLIYLYNNAKILSGIKFLLINTTWYIETENAGFSFP